MARMRLTPGKEELTELEEQYEDSRWMVVQAKKCEIRSWTNQTFRKVKDIGSRLRVLHEVFDMT